jgi:hypothetical protein
VEFPNKKRQVVGWGLNQIGQVSGSKEYTVYKPIYGTNKISRFFSTFTQMRWTPETHKYFSLLNKNRILTYFLVLKHLKIKITKYINYEIIKFFHFFFLNFFFPTK